MSLFETALSYRDAGLDVIPNHPEFKYPYGFEGWQMREFSTEELREKLEDNNWNIGVRGVEGLDFDNKGNPSAIELAKDWKALVEISMPGLTRKLLIEKTLHGGFHVVWKCNVIEEGKKLARRLSTAEELADNPREKTKTLVETRGVGNQFVVAPSKGYELIQGDWTALPTITPEEREFLISSARSLDMLPRKTSQPLVEFADEADRPGDIFNRDPEAVHEAFELLTSEGWQVVYERNEAVYLRRPGKDRGVSATFGHVAPGIFYCFTSSSEFEPDTAYSPFAIYTMLKFGGDFRSAASELARRYSLKTKKVETTDIAIPELDSERLIDSIVNPITGLSFGYHDFDETFGGLLPEFVYLYAAKSGNAKSTLALNILYNVASRGTHCTFFDLENGENLGDNRLLRIHTGWSKEYLKKFQNNKTDELLEKVDELRALPLAIYYNNNSMFKSGFRLEVILEAIRKVVKEKNSKLVFIDNLSCLDTEDETFDEFMKGALTSFSQIANQLKISIVLIHHISIKDGDKSINAKDFTKGNTAVTIPPLSKVLGTSHLVNKVMAGFTVALDQYAQRLYVWVQKNRDGKSDKRFFLNTNLESGRILEPYVTERTAIDTTYSDDDLPF